MARSPENNPLAFVAEVARYLCSEVEDVERMMRMDHLPFIALPKAKRTVKRIPLRDLHGWLRKRAKNNAVEFASYETFLADFNQVARSKTQTAA
jgi:hypothetical protein